MAMTGACRQAECFCVRASEGRLFSGRVCHRRDSRDEHDLRGGVALSRNPVGLARPGPQAEDWTLLTTYFF